MENKTAYITEQKADTDCFARPRPHGFSLTAWNRCQNCNAKRFPTIEAAKKAASKKGLIVAAVYLIQK
jgi:trehalose/maltose hydrolase-like predicted phosphorylase